MNDKFDKNSMEYYKTQIKYYKEQIKREKNPLNKIYLNRELIKLQKEMSVMKNKENKIINKIIKERTYMNMNDTKNDNEPSFTFSDMFSSLNSPKTLTMYFDGGNFIPANDVDNIYKTAKVKQEQKKIPTAKEIKSYLDQYVIGQEDAKRALSVAVHNHYIRINSDIKDDIEIQKSNILMIGNSGSGKTLLAQTIAKYLDVPFASVDATSLTPAGIVGKDVEDIIKSLINAAHGDKEKASKGIIYIDEIDKVANNGVMTKETHNVKGVLGGETQSALLKLLEGNELETSVARSIGWGESSSDKLNIKNVLFICGGAFAGIEEYTWKETKSQIGFTSNLISNDELKEEKYNKGLDDIGTEELIKYGMMPEIIGRLPVLVKLKPLLKNDLIQILTQPKNALIKQYQKLFEIDGVNLDFSPDALELIAEMAIVRKVGARGLRGIVEQIMTNIMFELPCDGIKRNCYVTAENIKNNLLPNLIKI